MQQIPRIVALAKRTGARWHFLLENSG